MLIPPALSTAPKAAPLGIDVDAHDGRYHRQELITWWDQERLRAARVLVVGAGALGNELVKGLALLGVGRIVVVDFDRIELSNLARCVFFREEDEGRPKAEVLAAAATRLNPDVAIEPVVGDVRLALGMGAIAEFDVVLGGLDNREARLHVNQACWKASVPWVDGAIEGLMGVMRAFVPPASACYECTMGEADRRLLAARRSCTLLTPKDLVEGKVPTTATSASVVAALQVQEAVKLLHRDSLPYEFAGRGVCFNGLTHDTYTVAYARDEHCLSHDTYALEKAAGVPATATFAALLRRARTELGGDAVLDLEFEIALSLSCAACGAREEPLCPVIALAPEAGRCAECGEQKSLDSTHVVDAGTPEVLLRAPVGRVGLPPRDVITGRTLRTRSHYRLEGGA